MNVSYHYPAMGSHLFKLKPHLKLLVLCVLFVNCFSVCLTFSVSDSEQRDILDEFDEDEPDYEPRTHFHQHELEHIKKTMIQGFGFKKVPDVTKMNVSQEEYARMYDVYLKRLEEKQTDDTSHIEVVPKLYTFQQKERRTRRKRRRGGVTQLVFDVTAGESAVSVEQATLRLLAPGAIADGPVRVQVYQLLSRQRRRVIDERDIHLAFRDPKWCEFDVTSAVRSWLEDGERNLGIELHCRECGQYGRTLYSESGHANNSSVINALMVERERSSFSIGNERDKRSAEQMLFYEKNRRTDCRHNNNKRCCRHKMDFDVGQLGLDFIIQPKKFDGGICKGRCPPHYNAAHNHAMIQSIMWKKNKNLTPRVCCAPSKLHHVEILMVDEDDPAKLTVKKWENTVVLECACS